MAKKIYSHRLEAELVEQMRERLNLTEFFNDAMRKELKLEKCTKCGHVFPKKKGKK